MVNKNEGGDGGLFLLNYKYKEGGEGLCVLCASVVKKGVCQGLLCVLCGKKGRGDGGFFLLNHKYKEVVRGFVSSVPLW